MTGVRWSEEDLAAHNARMSRHKAGTGAGVAVAPRPVDATNDTRAKAGVEAEAAGRVPRPHPGRGVVTAKAEPVSREAGLRNPAGERRLLQRKARPCALGGDVTGGERPAPNSNDDPGRFSEPPTPGIGPARGEPVGVKSPPKSKWPEQVLQKAVVEFLDVALEKYWRVVHVANGVAAADAKAKRANAFRKAMGVRAGFPDLVLLSTERFVVIELKAPGRRKKLSTAQEEWRDWFHYIGAHWFVCESLDEVIAACQDAGVPLRVRLS